MFFLFVSVIASNKIKFADKIDGILLEMHKTLSSPLKPIYSEDTIFMQMEHFQQVFSFHILSARLNCRIFS